MRAIAIAASLSLPGCADVNGLASGDGWHESLEHAPLPPVWVVIDQTSIPRYCGPPRGRVKRVTACAVRDYTMGACWIYAEELEDAAPVWVRRHEIEHCAGRDHD